MSGEPEFVFDDDGDLAIHDGEGNVFPVLGNEFGDYVLEDPSTGEQTVLDPEGVEATLADAEHEAELAADSDAWVGEWNAQLAKIEAREDRQLSGTEKRALVEFGRQDGDRPDLFRDFDEIVGYRDLADANTRRKLSEEIAQDAMDRGAAEDEAEAEGSEDDWEYDPEELRTAADRKEAIKESWTLAKAEAEAEDEE